MGDGTRDVKLDEDDGEPRVDVSVLANELIVAASTLSTYHPNKTLMLTAAHAIKHLVARLQQLEAEAAKVQVH